MRPHPSAVSAAPPASPSPLGRILRFALVGFSGVLVNLGLLGFLVEWARWHPLLASLLAIEASTLTNYVLNRAWTWRDRDRSWWSLVTYHGVTLAGIVGQWVVLLMGTTLLGLHYLLAATLGIGAATAWNFLANHRLTFVAYTPERRARITRVALYASAFVLQAALSAVLWHHWDTFVFQKSVEDLLGQGLTPYEAAAQQPDYVFDGAYPLWYAYPPLPLLLMAGSYAPTAFGLASAPWLGRLLVKLPFVLATIATAWTAERLVRTAPDAGPDAGVRARRLERFLLFNPLFVIVATVWGQFEALMVLFLFLSILAMRGARWATGGALWGLAALVKIFPFYLGPVLAVHLVRRGGSRAMLRYFGAGAIVFASVSLPFFLIHPTGYLEQVFLMHGARRPGRFAPIGYMFGHLRTLSHEWPGLIPDDAGLIRALSLFSFTLTALVLLLIAAAHRRAAPTERNLLLACAASFLGGILATKTINEQYLVPPIAFLALYAAHAGRDGGAPARWARNAAWSLTIFIAVASIVDSLHFLTFFPDDVARWLFGASVPQTAYALATNFGLTTGELRSILDTAVAWTLIVPFIVCLRFLGPALADGVRAVGALAASSGRVALRLGAPRLAMALVVVALAVPPLSVGVLSPKWEAPGEDSGVVEGPLLLVHYRADWTNPTLRPNEQEGNWDEARWTPQDGYYQSNPHVVMEDIEVLRSLGADALVFSFNPTYEPRTFNARTITEQERFPYALEVDLGYVANEDGLVALTPRTADLAAELVDGPGSNFWSGGFHLRQSVTGGYLLFLAGASRVQPTFTNDELRHVAQFLDAGQFEHLRLLGAVDVEPWHLGPTSHDALAAPTPHAEAWRRAYARAEAAWWRNAFAVADNDTRLDVVADAPPPAAWLDVPAVTWVGRYTAFPGAGTDPGPTNDATCRDIDLCVRSIPAEPGNEEAFDAAWQAALEDADAVIVPWNDFHAGLGIEPTREHGNDLLGPTYVWAARLHAEGNRVAYGAVPPMAAGGRGPP